MEVPWTLIPAARLNADPARRPAIEGALSVGGVRYYVTGRYRLIEGALRCRGTPVPLAYGVYILCGDHEYTAGSACFVPGGFQTAVRFAAYFGSDEELPARVDIELRPEQARAPRDVTEIWGGVVTFNDVPIASANSAAASPDPGRKGGN